MTFLVSNFKQHKSVVYILKYYYTFCHFICACVREHIMMYHEHESFFLRVHLSPLSAEIFEKIFGTGTQGPLAYRL